jgi:hypothetical protein
VKPVNGDAARSSGGRSGGQASGSATGGTNGGDVRRRISFGVVQRPVGELLAS